MSDFLIQVPKGSKLNLGVGKHYKDGYINIDWDSLVKTDVQHNLNTFPYPFPEQSFSCIEAFHILEHLDRVFDVMRELHRLLEPNGVLHIKVPHFSRGFTHAEHSHGFDITFPTYFNSGFLASGYTGVEFKLEKLELHWSAFSHIFPNLGYGKVAIGGVRVLNTLFSFLANLSPALCSRLWCYWVGGFEELEIVLRKV
jgi:SAM-dependent methyltransferase